MDRNRPQIIILKWGDIDVLKKKNKFFLAIALIVLLLLPISVLAYDNPTTKTYSWDDSASNSVFDIKSDKKVYSNLTNEIVYYKVTNLTNVRQDLDIKAFFSEGVTINYFGEWKDLPHEVPVYTDTTVYDNVYVNKSDLNFVGGCVGKGYLDYDITRCYFTKPRIVRTWGVETQTYPDWKKSKAQAWQTKPSLIPSGFNSGGQLATINVGKNEVKYFVLDFTHKAGTTGEFYLCGNNDCLDPFWDMDWQYKRRITITNNNAGVILKDNNNAIKIRLTTELGVKADANCNDVRIVKGEVLELDRNIFGNCQSDANIYFELPTQIAAGGTDNNYWIYYGNAAAAAPTNPANLSLTGLDSTTNYLYRFDYENLDSIINSNVLVDAGTVGKTGIYNKGANSVTMTNATNKYLVTTNASTLTNPLDFSVDFFINVTTPPSDGTYWWLASTFDATSTEGWDLIYQNTGGTYYIMGRTTGAGGEETVSVAYTLTANVWYHLQYTYSATTGIKIYVNGTNIGGSATTTKYLGNQNQKLYIGNDGRGVNNAYTPSAIIDEFRIRNLPNQNYFAQADMNATLQATTALGAEEGQLAYTINFNIYRTGTASHLTSVRMDCNDTIYSLTGQNSPFTQNIVVDKNVICSFARAGYNDNNTNYVVADVNLKTYTFYLSDTTAPSVGVTTLTGFTEYDSGVQKYFKGNGHVVGGAATDAGSGIDNTTCEIQYFNGAAWFSGLWDVGGFCYSSNFTAADTTDYNFNTRVKDLATNQGTGTATDSYIGDSAAPTTTLSVLGGDFNYTTFRLTCADAGSGCKNTWYKSDSNTWVLTTAPYDFNVFGIGAHRIYYNSSDNLDTNEALKTYDFNIYGNIRLNFHNEVGGAALTDVNVTFNSVVYNTGTTYFVDVNLQGITPTTYTFTLSKTGYSTRYYQIDLNELMDLNKNFALIVDTLDSDIAFTFYKPDQTTLYANVFAEFLDMDTNYIIGRLKTNAAGEATFNLKTNDSNYYQDMNNREYLYIPVSLTIYYPKNEETLAQIDENWQVDITQNIYASYPELDGNKVVYLLPNTTISHNLKISDMNGNYFSRNYSKQYLGNPQTDTLQPYLVSTATGLLTTITVKNAVTGAVEDNIRIKIYKDIGGLGSTLVEEVVTDSKGQALTLLVLGDSYTFKVYNGITLLKTYTITASSNTIFIYVYLTSGTTFNPPTGYKVTFTPMGTGLTKITVGNATFTQTIYNLSGASTTYTSQIIQNGVVLSTQSYTGTDSNKTFTRTVAWTDITTGVVISRLTITVGGVSYRYDQNYYVTNSFGSTYNLFTGLSSGLRSDMGCSSTGLCMPSLALALMISLVFALFISFKLGVLNPQSTGFILVFLMALFTYLTWVPLELTAAMVLILVAFVVNERRG